MRLVRKEISAKDGEGKVTLYCDDGEDMWHVYNLIGIGDAVTATTIRKVVKEGTTAVSSQRVRLNLTIRIISVDFDPEECSIRVAGRNIVENQHVKLGAHHTVELEPHRNFSIHKERWDTIYLERLDTACNPVKQAKLAAVVMQQGLAHVCLITGHMTLIRSKIEKNIPKKRASGKIHKESVKKFMESVLQAMIREIDFAVIKCILIASPGYVKDDFFKYIMGEAHKRPELKDFLRNKDQFVLVHASSGYKHALDQVLADPGIQSRLMDTQAAREVQILNKFFEMLNESSDRAFYSYLHVNAALEKGAIGSLLVTDSLFRSSDVKTRRMYVKLVEAAREAGAKVYIFSALHSSGEQLEQLSGVAAILRYPLPELDELEIEDAGGEDKEDEPYMAPIDFDESQDLDEDEGDDAIETALDAGIHHDNLTHDQEDAEEILKDMFEA